MAIDKLENRIGISATGGDDRKALEDVLSAYAGIGYRHFEAWMSGRGSALDLSKGARFYRELAAQYRMDFCSLHMPALQDASASSIDTAVDIARFATDLGVHTVTFEAVDKETYIKACSEFLKRVDGMDLTAVVQLHEGRSIGTIDDLYEVLDRVGNDRLKVQHEVGSFHALHIPWKEVCDRFDSRIGLVHLKDMVGNQSVPFGTGEIDVRELIAYMERSGYRGYYVVEIAPKDRENTTTYFADAWRYLTSPTRP